MTRRGLADVGTCALRWAVALGVLVAMPSSGVAQVDRDAAAADAGEDAGARPPARIGYGAMPGGLHVASAETLPAGTVEISALGGAGYRKGLLGPDHTLERTIGDLAVAGAPIPDLVLGLSLDGRYDRHRGLPGMTGEGHTGDLHLLARYAVPRGRIALGGQLGVWLPGKGAPSIALSATSIDARGVLSLDAGFATVSADAGFRIDHSARVTDAPDQLSVEHRVSLGVSEFHAALAGIELRIPAGGRGYVALEGSADVLVGKGAPGPILRGTAVIGVTVRRGLSILGYVELARVPGLDYSDVMAGRVPLIPYEPAVTGGLGIQAQWDRPQPAAAVPLGKAPSPPVVEIETADVTGRVVDDSGRPVAGAKIAIQLADHTGTAVTDDSGAYTVARLPIGKTVDGKLQLDDAIARISAEAADRKPASTTVTLTRGSNTAPDLALDPVLPPGELRVVIVDAKAGRPIAGASVALDPGGATATAGPDGKLRVELPPGRYEMTVTAHGFAPQQLEVNVEQNGVAIKNIEMYR